MIWTLSLKLPCFIADIFLILDYVQTRFAAQDMNRIQARESTPPFNPTATVPSVATKPLGDVGVCRHNSHSG